jgi:hypothetical protein
LRQPDLNARFARAAGAQRDARIRAKLASSSCTLCQSEADEIATPERVSNARFGSHVFNWLQFDSFRRGF